MNPPEAWIADARQQPTGAGGHHRRNQVRGHRPPFAYSIFPRVPMYIPVIRQGPVGQQCESQHTSHGKNKFAIVAVGRKREGDTIAVTGPDKFGGGKGAKSYRPQGQTSHPDNHPRQSPEPFLPLRQPSFAFRQQVIRDDSNFQEFQFASLSPVELPSPSRPLNGSSTRSPGKCLPALSPAPSDEPVSGRPGCIGSRP